MLKDAIGRRTGEGLWPHLWSKEELAEEGREEACSLAAAWGRMSEAGTAGSVAGIQLFHMPPS